MVTSKNIDDDLTFDRGLPPDSGVVTPIGSDDLQPEPEVDKKLQVLATALETWKPAQTSEPIQRVRNELYVMAVPDVYQLDIEKFVPWYVFDKIVKDTPKDDLVKILYWIACNPSGGADPMADDMRALSLPGVPSDVDEVRNRAAIYGVKLLGRLIGKIQ
jgi:hypothetical protein